MAITVREMGGSRGGGVRNDDGSATDTLKYWVYGSNDLSDVLAAVLAVAPSSFGGKAVSTYTWDFIQEPNNWEFTFTYSTKRLEPSSYTVSIDTTGGTVRTTSAYATTRFAKTGETATDHGNAIDVQDGVPQGVDVIIPLLSITVNARIHPYFVPSPEAYAETLASITGTTNNAPFLGFAAGALLFTGATGVILSSEGPQLQFGFLGGSALSNATIGDITGINKAPHDYLWYEFKKEKDSTSSRTSLTPIAAHVNQVYGSADHSLTRIGAAV